ncbi:D-glutamate cyclase, mitochondrial-like [Heteronotia binoei]|uniref:D-glutamate cyclase, mitochondrial-like n=2 Tax=Heteronotia binoei TaxID=13085 RepID=UPI002931CAB3|nr:D-glutamate cyclase, mitochondrial isoform X1 [Heteronotia binoei]XP_060117226.1 D-glutamate cyclase, mitochondrial-like [Heteronotia binoei]
MASSELKQNLEEEGMIIRHLRTLLPSVVRKLIRSDKLSISNTSGMSEGFKQANVIILHKSLADDFEKFCHANEGPVPLLYRSKPGEWKCPTMSTDSDIRTDCLQYRKYENGLCTGILTSLKEYSEQLKDMVTFYLGCSFTFEKAVQKVGIPVRNVEQKCNVSMYKTAVPCCDSEHFHCNLVVSMRPIPKDKLEMVVQTTYPMKKSHGAPVHIGNPGLLGIKDLSKVDYGDEVQAHPEDVPVFWACGVTGVEAISNCKSPLAFTHSPGCMFITDLKDVDAAVDCGKEIPEVYCICQNPLHYSIASATAVQKIRRLEEIIGVDPGDRGVKHLCCQDELLRGCLSISHAHSVLITTGFPTHFSYEPPEENDGPPGAIAMAAILKALGKHVAIVTDQRAINLIENIIKEAVKEGILKTAVPVLSYHGKAADSALHFLCEDGNPEKPKFSHLIAIERAGMAADGNYYNVRKINIKHLVDPIDELFVAARSIPGITTTGIGDGGNELGMGKVKEAVKKYIQNGDIIACDVEADFAVTAGVSNWGGYAVACALYILNTCEVHDSYLRKAIGVSRLSEKGSWASALPSVVKEEKLLNILRQHKVRSGKTASLAMEVDGLPFYDTHSLIIEKLLQETLK